MAEFGNICWYTNLDIEKRHENLILFRSYTTENYPHYDNYDAIEMNKVADIPCDYNGAIGVPITFMDKFNPEQFEILGATESEGKGFYNDLWLEDSKVAQPLSMVNVNTREFLSKGNKA
ncbi:MAG: adenine-specific methyltransferase EcoRI family protein [Ruminococcus sp.]|nr:adenine-specific methyltransferase EcoRI family protein [Ruminococcus sp.]MDE6848233.1 adenine-specific methyltransferase EcoRI family protein [Ruminococcus sp.]MDE7137068.1 adenine-specific methyltransferase EcoRI family protein [Ruminococcus sp.]